MHILNPKQESLLSTIEQRQSASQNAHATPDQSLQQLDELFMLVEVVAVGSGTIIAILATTVAADNTGVLLASLAAALGINIIPTRRQVKAEMRTRIANLRQQPGHSMRGQFEKEMERSRQRIQEATAPYSPRACRVG